jgi:hypothetical protein
LTIGAVLVIITILKFVVMALAAEAEIGAIFLNAKDGAVLRTTSAELGHPRPTTPLQTKNTTVTCYSNYTIKQKRLRAMNMQFYWIIKF